MAHNSQKTALTINDTGAPSDTTDRLYNDSGDLYFDGVLLSGGGVLPNSTTTGSLLVGATPPNWTEETDLLFYNSSGYAGFGEFSAPDSLFFGFRDVLGYRFINNSISDVDNISQYNLQSNQIFFGSEDLNAGGIASIIITSANPGGGGKDFTIDQIILSVIGTSSTTLDLQDVSAALTTDSFVTTATNISLTDGTNQLLVNSYGISSVGTFIERQKKIKHLTGNAVPGPSYTIPTTANLIEIDNTITTANLPQGDSGALDNHGWTITIKKMGSTTCTITPFAGDTVNGAATYSMTGTDTAITLYFNDVANDWRII